MNSKRFGRLTTCISLFLLVVISGCGEQKSQPLTTNTEIEKPVRESVPAEPEVEIVEAEPETEIVKPQEQPETPEPEGKANLALRFSPGDVTTYHVATVDTQQVVWEGSVPDNSKFENGRNYSKIEMKFTQEILDVDENGNALAKITIDGLKYHYIVRNQSRINYDSTKPASGNVMDFMIGRSYTIKIAPNGKVDVVDVKGILAGLKESSVRVRFGKNLIMPDVIERRHGLLTLPDPNQNPVEIEDQWSQTKTYSFGLMGSSTYEKIYTLKNIQREDNGKIALASMEAVPSTGTQEPDQAFAIKQMFDIRETYAGELKFNLDKGKTEEYIERLNIEWIALMPENTSTKGPPPVLKMSVDRSYYLTKLD